MSAPSPAELADLALEVAREAAALVRDRATRRVEVAATKSSAIDVVTEADRASEALIRDRILARRPDDAFLGEEGDDVAGTSGVRWIVDPIDGTVNFLYGIPQYAVSIAAEVDGEVVVGVVLDVAKQVEYVARPDPDGRLAATRDGEPIAVRGPRRRWRSAWSRPASPTSPRSRCTRASPWAACCRACATYAASGPARSTCATSPRDSWTATSRRASTCGTTPPAD